MDSFLSQNEHFIPMGDFNSKPDETLMRVLVELYSFINFVMLNNQQLISKILRVLLAQIVPHQQTKLLSR